MYEQVKGGWARSSADLSGTDAYWERSAAGMVLIPRLKECLRLHGRGRLLDAGAGLLPFRHIARAFCDEYRSLDIRPTHPDLDVVGDVQRMPLPDAQFDTVLNMQVLEHVPDPLAALKEMHRVLVPSGKLIISVPHLDYLHNEPYDYYRYTKHGLRFLLERAGFTVLHLEPVGGFFCFLHRAMATVGVAYLYRLPVIWPLFFWVNRGCARAAIWIDRYVDKRKLFAFYFVAVAQKPPL